MPSYTHFSEHSDGSTEQHTMQANFYQFFTASKRYLFHASTPKRFSPSPSKSVLVSTPLALGPDNANSSRFHFPPFQRRQ
jgi:hypothetical protein